MPISPSTKAVPLAAASRVLAATWRVATHEAELFTQAQNEGALLALFHGEQLPLILAHQGLGLTGLASRSADGAVLAAVLERLGYQILRGSSSRGGLVAGRDCLKVLAQGVCVAIAVDGPRGPAQVAKPGVVTLARMAQRPVVFARVQCSAAIALSSWDGFMVPAPGSRVDIHYGRWQGTDPAGLSQAMIDATGPINATGPTRS